MRIETTDSLLSLDAAAWDALVGEDYPFLRHAFLAGLERHDCLEPHGWHPSFLLAREGETLLGAVPLYLKTNSLGEFVFDWSWADAYERAGGSYYPKLVSAIPFVPSTGPRIPVSPQARDPGAVRRALIEAALAFAEKVGVSSLHWLFPTGEEADALAHYDLLTRVGCQYHWRNAEYADFDAFLATLSSKRRKQIRRERREVEASGVEIEVLHGGEVDARRWEVFHGFYCSTFHRRWGEPRLTLPFFRSLGERLPRQTLLLLARHDGEYVAGAFAMVGRDALFGRHWGCSRQFRFLHFELCYYRTIDYCIRHGLRVLDAGAQGEHKVTRGFTPVRTWSSHWLRDPGFSRAVADFLERETPMVDRYIRELDTHSPYRRVQ